jgi:hypothetical protein
MKKLTSLSLAGALLIGAPGVVRAQEAEAPAQTEATQDDLERVVQLNREGVALYQKKKFEAARKALKQALDLCASAGLDRHPVAARTHVHLGIVIAGGFGQREIASRQFNEALAIQPDIALTPGVASAEIEDLFNESVVAVNPRSGGAQRSSSAMESVAAEEAAPSVARRAAASRNEDGDEDEDEDEDGHGDGRRGFQVGALVGAGVGWAGGNGDVNADAPVSSGFAAAKLGHVNLEAGYWATPNLMLSVQARLQKVSGPTTVEANGRTYEPASGATAFFAAVTWSPGRSRLRPYLSGAVGGGRIRHVVTLSNLHDCGPARNETCVDTVGAGPFLAGLGGGVSYDLGERLALVAGVNTQIGAPTFTFNIDFNAGVAFRL